MQNKKTLCALEQGWQRGQNWSANKTFVNNVKQANRNPLKRKKEHKKHNKTQEIQPEEKKDKNGVPIEHFDQRCFLRGTL